MATYRTNIVHGLPNGVYHDVHGKYGEFISSTQLKKYLVSPKHFKHCLDNPDTEQTDAMKFGSLFHSLMERIAVNGSVERGVGDWRNSLSVFAAPVNEKTGQPYGTTTKAYKEAYDDFMASNGGKTIVMQDDIDKCLLMSEGLLTNSGKTSVQARKLLKWAKACEVSAFLASDDGVGLKVRPDMLTKSKIIDWKTTSLEDLSEDSIAKAIIKYGYHISLAMYQFVMYQATGQWYSPILVFVQKQAPYDCVICDMSEWCYLIDDFGDAIPGVGALEFQRLFALHIDCVRRNEWPGVERSIPESSQAIMKPAVPVWYGQKILS